MAAQRKEAAARVALPLLGAAMSLFSCKAILRRLFDVGALRVPSEEAPLRLGAHCCGINSFGAALDELGYPYVLVWATELEGNEHAVRFLREVEGVSDERLVLIDESAPYGPQVAHLLQVELEVRSEPAPADMGCAWVAHSWESRH